MEAVSNTLHARLSSARTASRGFQQLAMRARRRRRASTEPPPNSTGAMQGRWQRPSTRAPPNSPATDKEPLSEISSPSASPLLGSCVDTTPSTDVVFQGEPAPGYILLSPLPPSLCPVASQAVACAPSKERAPPPTWAAMAPTLGHGHGPRAVPLSPPVVPTTEVSAPPAMPTASEQALRAELEEQGLEVAQEPALQQAQALRQAAALGYPELPRLRSVNTCAGCLADFTGHSFMLDDRAYCCQVSIGVVLSTASR